MRVLAITNVFPSAAQPHTSPFNRQQFSALGALCDLEVFATIPYFPLAKRIAPNSQAAIGARAPRSEYIDGLRVRHPRTLHLPRIGSSLRPALFVASLAPLVASYRGKVDVVLGSWAYPDGCAAQLLSRALGVPAVVKLHGSDINVVAKQPGPQRWLRWCLPRAAAVVAVSRALAREAEALGVAEERIFLVPNGVDSALFHIRDRGAARTQLGIESDKRTLLYVGNLKREKGLGDLAEAWGRGGLGQDKQLVVVGDGPMRGELEALARAAPGLSIVGAADHKDVPTWLAACDALVLPSWDEGTPNVVLEALACGRPVIATRVGGIPDLIDSDELGELVERRSPEKLRAAMLRVVSGQFDPETIARRGARGSWQDSAQALFEVLEGAVA